MSRTVRAAQLRDCEIIAQFNEKLAWETEEKRLDPAVVRLGVAAAIAEPATKGMYYVLAEGDEILGQLQITYEWSDWRNGWWWWIQSVYVKAEARGRGVFSTLYGHVLAQGKAAGDVLGLRLYVEKDNHKAQCTYARLGMEEIHFHIMQASWREELSHGT